MNKKNAIFGLVFVLIIMAGFIFMVVSTSSGVEEKPLQAVEHEAAGVRVDMNKNAKSSITPGNKPVGYVDRRTVDDIVAGRSDIMQSYVDLVQMARSGDSKAAYQLYLDLYRCNTLETHNKLLENVAASKEDKSLETNAVNQITSSNIACKGVSEEVLKGMTDWVVLSARMGNLDAKVGFLSAVLSQYSSPAEIISKADEIAKFKLEGLKHLNDAARQGSAGALAELANVYREGVVADRDYVMAYAYMMALERTGKVKLSGSALVTWGKDLDDNERARARALADRIYNSCCPHN